MTIKQAVSDLRQLIKKHLDTTSFTDSFLWSIFNAARHARIYDKNNTLKKINPSQFTTFCLELQDALPHECRCIERGCKVKRTKYQLPTYLCRTSCTLSVLTLGGKELVPISSEDVLDGYNLDQVLKRTNPYMIINNYLYIFNQFQPSYIQVRAVWDDPTKFTDIQYCNEQEGVPCSNVLDTEIGFDGDLKFDILRDCLYLLNLPLQLMEDNSANNNEQ